MKSANQFINDHIEASDSFDRYYRKDVVLAMQDFAILSVEAALKKEWVPISEAKPNSDALYNVCYQMPNGKWHVFTSGYSILFKRFDEGNCNITHWMPLPKEPTV